MILNKPSGLLSVPGRGPDKADCLISRAKDIFPTALTVHRLDMETSGLIILALNKDMQRAMSRLFEQRKISKTYIARVFGNPSQESGRIDLPVITDWPNRPKQIVDHDRGKAAQTEWQTITHEGNITRLHLTPITGRTHQLRLHMEAMGHPILGDSLYGTPQSRAAAPRLQLHATTLSFQHPVSSKTCTLSCKPPF